MVSPALVPREPWPPATTITTLAGARAAVEAIAALQQCHQMEVAALQDIHVPWVTRG